MRGRERDRYIERERGGGGGERVIFQLSYMYSILLYCAVHVSAKIKQIGI